jgi:cytoplasmic iron level regulating protein YaaA (DUF328/UPF0246 family)
VPARPPSARLDNGRVLILLPPSETKTRPSEIGSPPLDLAGMALPAMRADRETMLRAAQRTAATAEAAAHLKVPASAPELVGRMLHLDREPAAPALAVYSGVLYDQLDPGASPDPERRVLVQSALFGLVDARDRIPAYRLSAGSTVSRLGRAGAWWTPRLRPVAEELRQAEAERDSPVVVDCRSGSYRSMMAMRSDGAVRVLEVSPVQERDGVRKVISHDAKRYRGLVTRALLAATRTPASADEVVDVVRDGLSAGLRVELEGDRLLVVDRAA